MPFDKTLDGLIVMLIRVGATVINNPDDEASMSNSNIVVYVICPVVAADETLCP